MEHALDKIAKALGNTEYLENEEVNNDQQID